MIRKQMMKRPAWQEKFEEAGFVFHSMDGEYWLEGICYEFSEDQIDYLDDVTGELHDMCMTAVDHIILHNRWDNLAIPESWRNLIIDSWNRRDATIYGRLDLAYDGVRPAKLLEFNADTPTSLYESSIAQWLWLEELLPGMDQFNSIHEKLLGVFEDLKTRVSDHVVFDFTAITDHPEDFVTTEYLRDVAAQAGFTTNFVFTDQLGFNTDSQRFVNQELHEVQMLFKLYPWEWLLSDEFGVYLLDRPIGQIFEPAWKLLLANKGILAILWELYPGHPNLLEASFEPISGKGRFVKKPLFSREGANIQIFADGRIVAATDGPYAQHQCVFQDYYELPRFAEAYTLIGSWIIGNMSAGLGIREDSSVITRNTSRFVPHYFVPKSQ